MCNPWRERCLWHLTGDIGGRFWLQKLCSIASGVILTSLPLFWVQIDTFSAVMVLPLVLLGHVLVSDFFLQIGCKWLVEVCQKKTRCPHLDCFHFGKWVKICCVVLCCDATNDLKLCETTSSTFHLQHDNNTMMSLVLVCHYAGA